MTTHPPSLDSQLARELMILERDALLRSVAPLPPHPITNFSSNDYLGLATHPSVTQAYISSLTTQLGAGAARLVGANDIALPDLEQRVASLKQTEAALLYSSGYQANLGVIPALLGSEDAAFCDLLNHASLIDGCRLSNATVFLYRHLDLEALERKLRRATRFRRRLIVSESVFGMDGDLAPVDALVHLASRYDALLYLDEAHATGIYGPKGRGIAADSPDTPTAQLVTFGKAVGTFGAAVAGSSTLINYLVNRSRTFIFTTALPPAICRATAVAIDLIQSEEGDNRRRALRRNVAQLIAGYRTLGLPHMDAESPIQPIRVGDPATAVASSRELLRHGLFVQAIRPPTVPRGTSRLRITLSAQHTPNQIELLLAPSQGVVANLAQEHTRNERLTHARDLRYRNRYTRGKNGD